MYALSNRTCTSETAIYRRKSNNLFTAAVGIDLKLLHEAHKIHVRP